MIKGFRDLPLRRKLMVGILVASVVPLFLAAVLVWGYQMSSLRRLAVHELEVKAEVFAAALSAAVEFKDLPSAKEVLTTQRQRREVVAVGLYDREGALFASYHRAGSGALPPLRTGYLGKPQPVGEDLEIFHSIYNGPDLVGHLYLRTDLAAYYDRMPAQGAIVLGVLIGLLGLAGWLSREFQRMISAPILSIAETVREVGERKDYSVRAVQNGGRDEISTLSEGFNKMLAVIQMRDAALQATNDALSTENVARYKAEESIRTINAGLEHRVQERTAELLQANATLTDFKAALDEHAIVAITDARGKITYANDKFCAISKYAREELIGQDHRIINSRHHPKAFIRELWQTITSGHVWHGEFKNRAKDGSFYWVDATIVPFLGSDGKPSQYIAIRTDITERKLAEERVARLNVDLQKQAAQLQAANKELESFSYSVSHDLRAPLRHIHSYVEMLTATLGQTLAEQPRRHLQIIANSAEEMGRLIDALLDFSRMGRAELTEAQVPLEALVQEVWRGLEPEVRGRNLQWQLAPLPPVLGDATMLKQVLANLLGNAVKYTRGRDPACIEVGIAGEEEGRKVFFVRDNGAGFDMRYAGKLFGVFQRLHRAEEFEGTGIGLATVQRILVRHGGRIWAEGKVGAGATFYFTLRLAEEKIRVKS